MLDNKKKPKEEPIKPVAPSSQPGTPIRKAPDELPVKPVEPSEKPGTTMPFDEPKENNKKH
ncbi:MAG: hypothetical protein KAQ87_05285 [Candidatus Pacebacteria bacterium]|nr:hypothetical protein [Candidatus Paceibacterota bacterium]